MREPGSAVYWRRRAVAVSGVLGVGVLLVWALSGTGGPTASQPASTPQAMTVGSTQVTFEPPAPGANGMQAAQMPASSLLPLPPALGAGQAGQVPSAPVQQLAQPAESTQSSETSKPDSDSKHSKSDKKSDSKSDSKSDDKSDSKSKSDSEDSDSPSAGALAPGSTLPGALPTQGSMPAQGLPQAGELQQPSVMPQQPGLVPQQPGLVQQQPGLVQQQPSVMPAQPGLMPQQPGVMPQTGVVQQPGTMPQVPQQTGVMPQTTGYPSGVPQGQAYAPGATAMPNGSLPGATQPRQHHQHRDARMPGAGASTLDPSSSLGGTPGSTGATTQPGESGRLGHPKPPKPAKPNPPFGGKHNTLTSATGQQPTDPADAPACADDSIGLVAQVGAPNYKLGERPAFRLIVANLGKVPCTRNLDPGLQQLTVNGPDGARVWSSNDCDRAHRSAVQVLEPGRPVTFPVSWTARTSSPGCSGKRADVPAGAYQVVAKLGALTSKPASFQLAK